MISGDPYVVGRAGLFVEVGAVMIHKLRARLERRRRRRHDTPGRPISAHPQSSSRYTFGLVRVPELPLQQAAQLHDHGRLASNAVEDYQSSIQINYQSHAVED